MDEEVGLFAIFGFLFRGVEVNSLFVEKLVNGCCCAGSFLFVELLREGGSFVCLRG